MDRIEELTENASSPRVQFVAEYLLKQEKLLEAAVHESLKGAAPGTLDAFVDAKPSLDPEGVIQALCLPDVPTVDDLTGSIFKSRDLVIEVFRESARCAADRKVNELFLSLCKLEEGERNHLACSVMQLDGL